MELTLRCDCSTQKGEKVKGSTLVSKSGCLVCPLCKVGKPQPSTNGSMVAAVDHAKSSAASCGRVPSRAAKASVAARAPAAASPARGS